MGSFILSEVTVPTHITDLKVRRLVLAFEIAIKLLECEAKLFAIAVALENALTEFRKPEKVAAFPAQIQQRRIV